MACTSDNNSIQFGDTTVTRVIEWAGPIRTVGDMLPDTPSEEWRAHQDLLAPDFWNPDTDAYLCHIQTWVIRTGGRTILVDTGVGNDRRRPAMPALAHWHTDFLERLATVGVEPEDVDIVINTHIHSDHVGWNTHLVDGSFIPTFPNAIYLVPRVDYDYFHPDHAEHMRSPKTEDERQRFDGIRLVFEDSIAPVERSGQLQLWQRHYDLAQLPVSLEPAPGHTPGSSLVQLRAGSGALFVGDLLHSPMQVLHPHHSCCFDLDAAQARDTRQRILARAASDGSMILPAHLPGHSAATIKTAQGDSDFSISKWAGFPRSPAS